MIFLRNNRWAGRSIHWYVYVIYHPIKSVPTVSTDSWLDKADKDCNPADLLICGHPTSLVLADFATAEANGFLDSES